MTKETTLYQGKSYASKIVASIFLVLRCLGQQDVVTWYSDYSYTDSGKQFVKDLGMPMH